LAVGKNSATPFRHGRYLTTLTMRKDWIEKWGFNILNFPVLQAFFFEVFGE